VWGVRHDQDLWADMIDVATIPLEASLALLKGLHPRWLALFESLDEEAWVRVGIHTEAGEITPEDLLRIYSDHGEEHIAQIKMVLSAGGFTL
jgi:hypothetical protein